MQKKTDIKKITFLKRAQQRVAKIVRIVAPGFVVGAGDNDPSGIGTYSIAGAQYGLGLAWLMPFLVPLLFAVQEMCGRIGLVTGQGLLTNMKKTFSLPVVYGSIVILVIANVFNIGANLAIMSECSALLCDHNSIISAALVTVAVIVIEVFVPYRRYSKILFGFSLFLLAYIITAFMIDQDWSAILYATVTPTIQWNKDYILVATGIIGTTVSPYLFFWQTSQEVEEKIDHVFANRTANTTKQFIKEGKLSVLSGMFFTQIVAFFIIVTTFSTLHKNGITEINSAYDAAIALKPFAGDAAVIVFALGIVGAGFLGISVLAGSSAYALSELFNKQEGLSLKLGEAPFFYSIIALSVLAGFFMNFIGINSMKALFYSAVINCVVSVPILAFTLILANKKEVMGKYANGVFSNIVGWFTFIVMLVSTILSALFALA